MDQPATDAAPSWLDQPAATPAADATPSWLDQPVTTSPTDATPSWIDQPAASASTDEIPDWLKSMPSSQIAPTPTSELAPAPTSAPSADDVQGWLSSAVTAPAEPQPGATNELPDWLKESSPEAQTSDEVPDWLKSVTSSLKTETTPTSPLPATAQPADESIPDFMKDMGWTLRDPSKPLEEPNVFADTPATESKPDEAAPAQLPDWLKDLKPQQEEPKLKATGDAPDWLRAALEGEAAPTAPAKVEQDAILLHTPTAPTAKAATPKQEDAVGAPSSEDDALAWLESLAARQGAPAEELVSTPQSRKKVSTDWLREPIAEDAPDKPTDSSPEESVPEWLRLPAEEPKAPPPIATQPITSSAPSSEDDALAWLESLAARQGAPADELVSSSKGSAVATPDWLKDPTTQQLTPPAEEKPEPSLADWLKKDHEEETPAAQPQDEIPDWLKAPSADPGDTIVSFLKDKQTSSLPPTPKETPHISAIGEPDWARQLSEQDKEVPTPRISAIGTAPDWLKELSEQPEAAQPTAPVQEPSLDDWLKQGREEEKEEKSPAPTTPFTSAETFTSTEEGDALAWLESLAERQGAKPEELVSGVHTRTTETPAWVKKSAAEEKPFTPAEPEPQEEKPAWLRQMEAESDYYESSLTAPAKPIPETPEWLKPLEQPAAPFLPTTSSLDWLKPPLKETKPTAPISPVSPTPQGEEDALAWLESLAERQGAKPDELVSNVKDRDLETPEWVKQSSIEPTAPMPPAAEDKPDWLKQMEAESDAYDATLKPTAKPEQPAEEEVPEWLRALPPTTSPGDSIAAFLKDKPTTSVLQPVADQEIPAARIETPPPQTVMPPFVPEPPTPQPPITPAKAEPPAPRLPKPKRAPKPKARRADQPAPEVVLENARAHLTASNFGDAIEEYAALIKTSESLTDVIADLEKATQENPNTPELMQTLGDAYAKDGQLQRSLDVYRQALKKL
ncbi:MAG: hypothetical protein HY740_00165 [Chloroflexi bacterium]|nr:hypothetical protein [Chloroflexota bacterium]